MSISSWFRSFPRAVTSGLLVLALTIAAVTVVPATASGTTAREARMLTMLNRTRNAHGVAALQHSARLERRAIRNSKSMARKGKLSHSGTLRAGMAEIVGCGASLHSVLRAWMRSSLHRGIILDPYYRQAGVGVAKGRGALWITVTFRH